MAGSGPRPALPSPRVEWPEGFAARLEGFVPRMAARRERREGAGGSSVLGAGEEFIGHRPYREGEDLRRLDWGLLARSDQPFVRRTRREAAESWAVVVDTSASMGLGVPGKLSAAATLAAALATVGARGGARVQVITGAAPPLEVRRGAPLSQLLASLGELVAGTSSGVQGLLSSWRPPSACGLVAVLGDLVGTEPQDLAAWERPGRELVLAQVLAPEELEPPSDEAVRWFDPEGEAVRSSAGEAAVQGYERRLEAWLERWARAARRPGLRWSVGSSAAPFEDRARAVLEGDGA